VGVVSLGWPRPEILTDAVLDVNVSNPLQAVLRVGADVVKEVEASRARTRLDGAAAEADVPGRMMARVLNGMAGELRAVPVEDARRAEFEVEVMIRRYGIEAEAWTGPAHFFIESEVVLNDVITAAGLASLSPEAMVRTLEGLADFSADQILRSFRRGVQKSRG